MKGKLITFEGIDGSGKSTQTKLLLEHLEKEGIANAFLSFPQYGKKSAGLIEEYLAGSYGSGAEIGPYRASIFYACDRYDASFAIQEWLQEGRIVVTDRYIGSNVGHQGGKIQDANERKKFLAWLFHLEYEIFGIPKPDKTFFLQVPPELAAKLCENPERRRVKKNDIHENDREHLSATFRVYQEAAALSPQEIIRIECVNGDHLLAPEEIHRQIWASLLPTL
ncbi:MAG: dTMP kinase [Candidatus Yanofskybacteria bacterium]|nr:dTMP kinase [Candidatus Yanofskybacteria bacterium]